MNLIQRPARGVGLEELVSGDEHLEKDESLKKVVFGGDGNASCVKGKKLLTRDTRHFLKGELIPYFEKDNKKPKMAPLRPEKDYSLLWNAIRGVHWPFLVPFFDDFEICTPSSSIV